MRRYTRTHTHTRIFSLPHKHKHMQTHTYLSIYLSLSLSLSIYIYIYIFRTLNQIFVQLPLLNLGTVLCKKNMLFTFTARDFFPNPKFLSKIFALKY